jgi:hypothetical protein
MRVLVLSIAVAALLTSCSHLRGGSGPISAAKAAILVTGFANHELHDREFTDRAGQRRTYPKLVPADWNRVWFCEDGWVLEMNTSSDEGFYAMASIDANGKHPSLVHYGFYEAGRP